MAAPTFPGTSPAWPWYPIGCPDWPPVHPRGPVSLGRGPGTWPATSCPFRIGRSRLPALRIDYTFTWRSRLISSRTAAFVISPHRSRGLSRTSTANAYRCGTSWEISLAKHTTIK